MLREYSNKQYNNNINKTVTVILDEVFTNKTSIEITELSLYDEIIVDVNFTDSATSIYMEINGETTGAYSASYIMTGGNTLTGVSSSRDNIWFRGSGNSEQRLFAEILSNSKVQGTCSCYDSNSHTEVVGKLNNLPSQVNSITLTNFSGTNTIDILVKGIKYV